MTVAILTRHPGRSDLVTLGVQAIVRDASQAVLLVRHGYRPGWHFPGGGIERGETAESAVRRELAEEVGVTPTAPPRLWGIYSHFDAFPGDHIVLFVIDSWHRSHVPPPNYEIREHAFFDVAHLPNDLSKGARQRLREIDEQVTRSPRW